MSLILKKSTNYVSYELKEAWAEFNYKDALENGWEEFKCILIENNMTQIKNYPSSTFYRGKWIYQGSVSELEPFGHQITRHDAVFLSIQRWSPTLLLGTRPDLYNVFERHYHKKKLESKL